jgi:Domain of unknown function (DUF1929)
VDADGHGPRWAHLSQHRDPAPQRPGARRRPRADLDALRLQQHLPGGFSDAFRNPSFEIYDPPYLSWGPRPTIGGVSGNFGRGARVTVSTPDAQNIASVVLVRNTALTHLVDGDQRQVELPISARAGANLQVEVPSSAGVLPPGPYMLFVNKRAAKGLVPSTARQLTLP